MIDSLAKPLIESVKPSTSPEFYFLVIVLGLVACWGLYLYFKTKGGSLSDGTTRNKPINQNVQRLHPDDNARLDKIEESVRALGEAFKAGVHERGDLMGVIGNLTGRLEEISKRVA